MGDNGHSEIRILVVEAYLRPRHIHKMLHDNLSTEINADSWGMSSVFCSENKVISYCEALRCMQNIIETTTKMFSIMSHTEKTSSCTARYWYGLLVHYFSFSQLLSRNNLTQHIDQAEPCYIFCSRPLVIGFIWNHEWNFGLIIVMFCV